MKAAFGIIDPPYPLQIIPTSESSHFSSLVVENVPDFGALRIKMIAPSLVQEFFPHRLISALITENQMTRAANQSIESHGVCVLLSEAVGKPKLHWLPAFEKSSQICIVYGFRKDMKSLSEILEGGAGEYLTNTERILLKRSATALHHFHSRKPLTDRQRNADDMYNMSLSHLMAYAGEFAMRGRKSSLLTDQKIERLTVLILRTLQKWFNRGDRVGAPTGDLQFSHILIGSDDEVVFIDLSRFQWGEARGFDIGWLMCESMWEWLRTGKKRIKRIARTFLKAYEDTSEDKELRKALLVGFGIKALVLLQIHGQRRRKFSHVDKRGQISKKMATVFYRKAVRMLTVGQYSWR